MLIAIVNNSTMATNAQLELIAQAIQIQLDLHFCPAWNLKSGTVKFYADPKTVPGYAWTIFVIDNDTQVQGALGFHQEETTGQIDAYIMCQPILSNGGTVLDFNSANPGQYSVSGTISHEALETVADRFTNVFCDNGSTSYCQEVADPVEQIGYGITVNGTNVAVSDFVFPNFFNPDATVAKNGPFNYLKTVTAPFKMLAGGYMIERTGGPGTETQVFGEAMPEFRRAIKRSEFSRFNRRRGK